MTISIVQTTVGSKEAASTLSNICLEKALCACIQSQDISSKYMRKGAVANEDEVLLTFKTTRKQELIRYLQDNHQYEVPEIVWYSVETTDKYGNRVRDNCANN